MVSTRSSSRAGSLGPEAAAAPPAARRRRSPRPPPRWLHAPTPATLLWLAVSLPLVAWDTAYVLGRPHTMPGGALHWPLWAPYALYGRVDRVYGWEAWHARSGFPAAQGFLNLVESLLYLAYLWLCFRGRPSATTPLGRRAVAGRSGAAAVLIGFSAAVMTLSKTVLYWLHEFYSGFNNIGHNPFLDLVYLWILPNGAWLVGSAYMVWALGGDILSGLEAASAHAKKE